MAGTLFPSSRFVITDRTDSSQVYAPQDYYQIASFLAEPIFLSGTRIRAENGTREGRRAEQGSDIVSPDVPILLNVIFNPKNNG